MNEVNKNTNQTIKKPNTTIYESAKIDYVINLLNNLPVTGFNNVNTMKVVFDLLTNPLKIDDGNEEISKE